MDLGGHVVGAARILVVEDDAKLAGLVSGYLASHGYVVAVEPRGDAAVGRILSEQPDVVVLDVGLPGLDGFEVCRAVRAQLRGAILMLTARGEDLDEVQGLELGADDFVAKPVRPRVLLARIRGLLRRNGAFEEPSREVKVAGMVVDAAARRVVVDGEEVELTTAEFDLLWFLACRAGEVVDRDRIYQGVRGVVWDGVDRSIDLRVSRLRRKVGSHRIKSVRGAGYLLVPDL